MQRQVLMVGLGRTKLASGIPAIPVASAIPLTTRIPIFNPDAVSGALFVGCWVGSERIADFAGRAGRAGGFQVKIRSDIFNYGF